MNDEIDISKRDYFKTGVDELHDGDEWWVHFYDLPEIDDYHVKCRYKGENNSHEHVFAPSQPLLLANDFQKLKDHELGKMVFKERH